MNINRNNYETFFLMYVDNELSAAERHAVELFIQENTDLAEELRLLQQTVLPGDSFVFDAKNSLLKEEHTALQENLLLYMDDELDSDAKKAVEKLLQEDAPAAKEFTLLQKTQLSTSDVMVFADKNSLYRKEPAKVIAFNWRRIAIAAILLGFGTWGTVAYLQHSSAVTGGPTADAGAGKPATLTTSAHTGNAGTNAIATTTQPAAATTTATDINSTETKATTATITKPKAAATTATKKAMAIPATHTPQTAIDNNATAQNQAPIKPSNNLPQPISNNFNKEDGNKTATAIVTPLSRPTVESGSKTTAQPVNNTNAKTEVTGYALNTKYIETDAGQEDNSNKKSKLGNLFRKVKRIVERTTNAPSGNGVKIATFDIAIK
ncbi:MAG: hypothetical protein JST86_04380 [Bacteroidetes bacterium]|nr:hypothetical protein [Bacteroidota bacterium]